MKIPEHIKKSTDPEAISYFEYCLEDMDRPEIPEGVVAMDCGDGHYYHVFTNEEAAPIDLSEDDGWFDDRIPHGITHFIIYGTDDIEDFSVVIQINSLKNGVLRFLDPVPDWQTRGPGCLDCFNDLDKCECK